MRDYTIGLNKAQASAVLKTNGALLLIAGAGSGKTKTLIHRMAYIAENLAKPYEILAITFTNKAANEMKKRAMELISGADDMWVSTFHSFCAKILRREIQHIGFDSNFIIYDSEDSLKIVKDSIEALGLDTKMKNYSPRLIKTAISRAKDAMLSPQEFATMASADFDLETKAKIYEKYQKKLQQNNALDFDDLIYKTSELFKKCPDVLQKYAKRFKYVMVDEYQDTNVAQYELVRLLSSVHKNICVVGDDDQSIYGWRGADIRNILNFEKDFPGAQTIKLEQNYRSKSNILDLANKVIGNNKGRRGKVLWADSAAGDLISIYEGRDDAAEATFIAENIQKQITSGAKHSDFAVLYRTNAQSASIENALFSKNIKYRVFGGLRFFDRREVKDIAAYLRIVMNEKDDISLKRIINIPKRGIGLTSIAKIDQYAEANGLTFFEAMDLVPVGAAGKKLAEFKQLINSFKEVQNELKLPELVNKIITDSGYLKLLKQEDTENDTDRASNAEQVIAQAEHYIAVEGGTDLSGFLEKIALQSSIDEHSGGDDYVSLMTLHSAKGLEFEVVFMSGLEEGIFPSGSSIALEAQLEEERRLCYVGITRAREKLYITRANRRFIYGGYKEQSPSRFFDEMPKDLLEQIGEVAPNYKHIKAYNPFSNQKTQANSDASTKPNFGKEWKNLKNIFGKKE